MTTRSPSAARASGVATTGSEPVGAQQSLDDDDEIEKETEESEGRARVAEITLSTGIRRSTQMPRRQCDRAGAVPDRLREGRLDASGRSRTDGPESEEPLPVGLVIPEMSCCNSVPVGFAAADVVVCAEVETWLNPTPSATTAKSPCEQRYTGS